MRARILAATALPSMSVPRPGGAPTTSACKIHRPCLADRDNLDLTGILQLRLDPPRDLLGQRSHPHVIDVVGGDDDTDFASRLNGEHLLHSLVARGDFLQ